MNLPLPVRTLLLSGVALILLLLLIARWIGDWGLVTIHVTNTPLGKVITSIERQGHVRIESAMDLLKPVSLDVDHVPVAAAIDSLALRADASWRLVYLVAPSKSELEAALVSLKSSTKVDDWKSYFYPIPFWTENSVGGVRDPRELLVSLEGSDLSLSQMLNQTAQKGGVMTFFPTDWCPMLKSLPRQGPLGKIVSDIARSVHGKAEEVFFLCERGSRASSGDGLARTWSQAGQPEVNPDWIEQRQLAQIVHLTPEKQAEAKREIAEGKEQMISMHNLSPEERRAKIKALMADPDRMEKFADRMLMRDSKLSADQRIDRALNYLSRKAAARSAVTP